MTTWRQQRFPAVVVRARGFTFVELIAVIVVVGILAAIAGSRLMDRAPFASVAFHDQTMALLRFAQKTAIAQNRNVFVRVNAAGVALCYTSTCNPGERVTAPGGANSNSAATRAGCADARWACESPPSGVTITPATQFYFDAIGKPFAVADVAPTTVSTFAPLAITVRAGASARTTTVEMETGYVH